MLVLKSQNTLKGLRERFLCSNMRKPVEINVLDRWIYTPPQDASGK